MVRLVVTRKDMKASQTRQHLRVLKNDLFARGRRESLHVKQPRTLQHNRLPILLTKMYQDLPQPSVVPRV